MPVLLTEAKRTCENKSDGNGKESVEDRWARMSDRMDLGWYASTAARGADGQDSLQY